MVEVGSHGAFSVNGIGLNGAPFPLSFSARKAGGSWLVDAAAAQAGELADVLTSAAGATIVVVDLAPAASPVMTTSSGRRRGSPPRRASASRPIPLAPWHRASSASAPKPSRSGPMAPAARAAGRRTL